MDCVAEFGVEVHYIKHEVKQSQIPHNLDEGSQEHLQHCCDEVICLHLAGAEWSQKVQLVFMWDL